MILRRLLPVALCLARARSQPSTAPQAAPGSFAIVGSTLVSAMMVFLGNDEKIYILDKAEGNPTQIDGHPAWGAVWDIATNTATPLLVASNTFCASGMHLPNGSFIALGGNNPVSPGPVDFHGPGPLDPTYQDADGRNAIRVLSPCTGNASTWGPQCQWFDNYQLLAMQKRRWYSTAEALADGSIAILGGMVNGGYINRIGAVVFDPQTQGGLAENTFEFYPARPGFTPQLMDILVTASGLNTYALAWLMKSGKMLVQANLTTVLWDTNSFIETPLPDMPNGVVRVYPASAATAMLPLTPGNNYNPTILFCGGTSAFTNDAWGGYGGPNVNSWEYGASTDCQRLTPEPEDGSAAVYIADDPLPVQRTMGQFMYLPDGTLLLINGAMNGTAGYTTQTPDIPVQADLPFGTSLATNPIFTPAIYDPNAPVGSRFSSVGLQASTIPRMYHSNALLLPDGSVFVAGSNPNPDYDSATVYPTEARAEIFYPPYWGKQRPVPQGGPTNNMTYGGNYFNITLNNGSYAGTPNVAAASAQVVLIRTGFNTHALAMGMRFLQLNNTYTVDDTGDITLHVAQHPPNANLLTPGPALMFVVVGGVPAIGKTIMIGSGVIGTQDVVPAEPLPPTTVSLAHEPAPSKGADGGGKSTPAKPFSIGVIIAAIAGGVAAAGVLAAAIIFCCRRKNAPAKAAFDSHTEPLGASDKAGLGAMAIGGHYRPTDGAGLGASAAYSTYSDMQLPLQRNAPSDYAQYMPRGAMAPRMGGRDTADDAYGGIARDSYASSGYDLPMAPPSHDRYRTYNSQASSAGGSPYNQPRELEYDPYEAGRAGGTRL